LAISLSLSASFFIFLSSLYSLTPFCLLSFSFDIAAKLTREGEREVRERKRGEREKERREREREARERKRGERGGKREEKSS